MKNETITPEIEKALRDICKGECGIAYENDAESGFEEAPNFEEEAKAAKLFKEIRKAGLHEKYPHAIRGDFLNDDCFTYEHLPKKRGAHKKTTTILIEKMGELLLKSDEVPEQKTAARIICKILTDCGYNPGDTEAVQSRLISKFPGKWKK